MKIAKDPPPFVISHATKIASYATSTHKLNWTFDDAAELTAARFAANTKYRAKFEAHLDKLGEMLTDVERREIIDALLDVDDEIDQCVTIASSARAFADKFEPPLYDTTRAIAYDLFRRFYTRRSVMDFAPRQVMVTAFYVATKVDDFYVSIARFVANLSSGTREDNEKDIRTLEPVLLYALDYNLVVYTPYRCLDGHLLMWKASQPTNVAQIEQIQPMARKFLIRSELSDVSMLYSPTQIALASLVYAARRLVETAENAVIDDTSETDAHLAREYVSSLVTIARQDGTACFTIRQIAVDAQTDATEQHEHNTARLHRLLNDIVVAVTTAPSVTREMNERVQLRSRRWATAFKRYTDLMVDKFGEKGKAVSWSDTDEDDF